MRYEGLRTMYQETQVYANVIDAIVYNSTRYHFQIPQGTYAGFDILKRIWFKIQKEKKTDTPDILMQRAMWLSSTRIVSTEDGISLQTRDPNGEWYHSGMYLVKKD